MFDSESLLYQVKITLAEVQPAVWRRLQLPQTLNFAQLHEIIQASFGWTDSHLHQFVVGGLIVGAPEFDDDGLSGRQTFEATEVFLRDLELHHLPSPKVLYEYDFGDGWRHWIEFESQPSPSAG